MSTSDKWGKGGQSEPSFERDEADQNDQSCQPCLREAFRSAEKSCLAYALAALFFVLFGAVYEHFSFGVYSSFMLYAFLFPLAGGAFPLQLLLFFRAKILPDLQALRMQACGVATLTVGSVLQGVLEIYGTSSPLIRWFFVIGTLWMIAALMRTLLSRRSA